MLLRRSLAGFFRTAICEAWSSSWKKAGARPPLFSQLGTLEKVVQKATPIGWTLRTVKFMLETQIAFPRDFKVIFGCQNPQETAEVTILVRVLGYQVQRS